VRHRTTPEYWGLYDGLPPDVRRLADKNFGLLKRDISHPSLQLKRVGRYWSVRVGLVYRAVAIRRDDDFVWFWIGPHDEYDKLLK